MINNNKVTGANNWSDKTVLIVDDIEINFLVIEAYLSDTGVKILYASNGKIAVEMCDKYPEIDVVLMDVKMPVMDGYEATRLIKSKYPYIPVVFQTACDLNELPAPDFCFEGYLAKPVSAKKVISAVSKVFSNSLMAI